MPGYRNEYDASGIENNLRSKFSKQFDKRLRYALVDSEIDPAEVSNKVGRLSEIAGFDLISSVLIAGKRSSVDKLAHRLRDAKKKLMKFIEVSIKKVRMKAPKTIFEFRTAWKEIIALAKEWCRKYFEHIDPNVQCRVDLQQAA